MGYKGDYVQWQYRMYAHMQLQSMGWLGAVGLNNATDNAPAMLPAPLYDTTADLSAGINQVRNTVWHGLRRSNPDMCAKRRTASPASFSHL